MNRAKFVSKFLICGAILGTSLIFVIPSEYCHSFRIIAISNRKLYTDEQCCCFFPKLFRPTLGKNCSSDREKPWKFEAEGLEIAKFLKFIQTVKVQNNFW